MELEEIDIRSSQTNANSIADEHMGNERRENQDTFFNLEEAWHNKRALERNEVFKSIVLNKSTTFS